MKPGIYLIEVKECRACRGSRINNRQMMQESWDAVNNGNSLIPVCGDPDEPMACPICQGLGYTETRIDAEAWLLSMLGRMRFDTIANWTGGDYLDNVRFETEGE